MTDISALEAYAGQQSEAAVKADVASEKQHECINADAQADVVTELGPVPSIAKQARLYLESTPDGVADLSGQMAGRSGKRSTAQLLPGLPMKPVQSQSARRLDFESLLTLASIAQRPAVSPR